MMEYNYKQFLNSDYCNTAYKQSATSAPETRAVLRGQKTRNANTLLSLIL